MSYEIRTTPQAQNDLRGIFEYDEEAVTIVRVMYGGRDIDRQLESMVKKNRYIPA